MTAIYIPASPSPGSDQLFSEYLESHKNAHVWQECVKLLQKRSCHNRIFSVERFLGNLRLTNNPVQQVYFKILQLYFVISVLLDTLDLIAICFGQMQNMSGFLQTWVATSMTWELDKTELFCNDSVDWLFVNVSEVCEACAGISLSLPATFSLGKVRERKLSSNFRAQEPQEPLSPEALGAWILSLPALLNLRWPRLTLLNPVSCTVTDTDSSEHAERS